MKISAELSNRFANSGLIFAFLVVCNHIRLDAEVGCVLSYVQGFVSRGLGDVAVPFFFFTSGFFLAAHADEPGWVLRESYKRLKSLLLPYAIWCALMIAYIWGGVVLSNSLVHKPLFSGCDFSLRQLVSYVGLNPWAQPVPGVLWYVRCLLAFVLLGNVFKKLANVWGLLILGALYALICPTEYFAMDVWRYPLRFFISIEGAFYFACGFFWRRKSLPLALKRWMAFALLFVGLLLMGASVAVGMGHPLWAEYLKWVAIPTLVFGVLTSVSGDSWPQKITSLAFPVFILHPFVIKTIEHVAHVKTLSFLACSVVWVWWLDLAVAIVGTAVLASLIRQVCPRISSLVFGGR